MKTRILGKDLIVSEIGLGWMGLNFSFAPFPTKEEAIIFLRTCLKSFEKLLIHFFSFNLC